MRIQSKLFLFAIFCSLVPLIATFVLSFSAVKNSLSATVEKALVSQATSQLEELQRDLAESKHELATLSKLRGMQFVQSGDQSGYLQADVETFAERTPLFTEIIATDYKGKVIAGNLHNFINSNVSGTWEFEAPKLGINFDGRVVESYRLGKRIATQSVPLYDRHNEKRIIGTLIGSINWEYLQRHLASHHVFGGQQGLQRRIYLESLESESILYGTAGLEIPYELLASADGDSKIEHVEINGRNYMMASSTSRPYKEFRDPKWRLHVLLDTEAAYASVDELKNYFSVTGAFVSILALLAGFLFARSIVRPVKSLLTGAERLAAGDYSYQLSKINTRDEIGQLATSFVSMRDAVQKKEKELVAETEMAEQAARLKGEFLANMSHEVRTPINGVMGMTELLLNTPLDKTQARYAKTISRSSNSLLTVINDILDFSKIEAGKLELLENDFDLRELVEDVTEMVAETAQKKGVELVLYMAPDSPLAFSGDSARLRQVLINLLSNAVKFTSVGEVKLQLSFEDRSDSRQLVTFKVVDTGIGIEEENQKKIFDSFVQADGTTTRQFGGTGLGLAISAKLVALMGGAITVVSVPNKGSTFSFGIELEQLPLAVEQAWRKQDALVGKRVLIVDDNKTNIEIIEAHVNFWGAQSTAAKDAKSALALIESVAGTQQMYDAAVLDMHMPNMDGLELATVLHERGLMQKMSVVLLSSASDVLDLQRCKDIGVSSLVNKPCRLRELYNCLTAAIDKRDVWDALEKEVAEEIQPHKLRGRVLLAEDNPVNQDMMLEMLKIMGISAELAGNGEHAISSLERQQFDLVLMDCQMPVMDGFSATKEIRRRDICHIDGHRIPIVALTANAMQGDKERCLESGMDDYMTKPVTSKRLTEMLSRWIEQPEYESSEGRENKVLVTPQNIPADQAGDNIIDGNIFAEVWQMCSQAPSGFYERLVDTYDTASNEDLTNIADAIKVADTSSIGSHAHRLKSSTASWGAQRMADLCKELEINAKNGELDTAELLLEKIISEHTYLMNWLREQELKAA